METSPSHPLSAWHGNGGDPRHNPHVDGHGITPSNSIRHAGPGRRVLIFLGLVLMIATIRLFIMVGKGTLAPCTPTQKFVQGVYRHVHNAMISGVMFILLGEAILAASVSLFIWFAVFVVENVVYIPMMEEQGLEKRFGGGVPGIQTKCVEMDAEDQGWEG